MSTKIGGPHRCNIHPDFPETDDTEVWNQHCLETEGHTTSGVVKCSNCDTNIELNEVPFQPVGKEIRLQCPDCYNKNQDLNKLVNEQTSVQQQQNNQQVQQGGDPL